MTFPLEQDGRVITAVPGARAIMISRDDALARARSILASLDERVLTNAFARVMPEEPETDPLLAGVGELVAGRISLVSGIAILPPSLRFDTSGHRLIGVRRYANGYTGYGIAPSEWRPGLAIWGFSEGGLMRHEEFATPWEWLIEFLQPFTAPHIETGDLDLAAHAQDMWSTIAGDLCEGSPPAPREPISDGVHTSRREGMEFEESYVGGVRHGHMRAWELEEIFDEADDADPSDLELERTVLRREGTFVDGYAHGRFRFYSETGKLAQEVAYAKGFPQGTCTVHPEATWGLCEPGTVEYVDGVPVKVSIPPLAHATARLDRPHAAAATLAEITGNRPVVLIDCHDQREHTPNASATKELAKLVALNVVLLGIGAETGHGKVGEHDIEIVVDRDKKLVRAYGLRNEIWQDYCAITSTGKPAQSGRLDYMRFVAKRLGLEP